MDHAVISRSLQDLLPPSTLLGQSRGLRFFHSTTPTLVYPDDARPPNRRETLEVNNPFDVGLHSLSAGHEGFLTNSSAQYEPSCHVTLIHTPSSVTSELATTIAAGATYFQGSLGFPVWVYLSVLLPRIWTEVFQEHKLDYCMVQGTIFSIL